MFKNPIKSLRKEKRNSVSPIRHKKFT